MPKIRSKVKRFTQESAHRQTDGHTDATERIIAPATRSILNERFITVVIAAQVHAGLRKGYVTVAEHSKIPDFVVDVFRIIEERAACVYCSDLD